MRLISFLVVALGALSASSYGDVSAAGARNSEVRRSGETKKAPQKNAAKSPSKKNVKKPKANPVADAVSVYETASDKIVPYNKIDEIIFADLKVRGLVPARLCSDAVFLRRVYLDLAGTVADVEKARAFLDDKSPDKRAKLVAEIVNSEAFVSRMTMRLGDMLRIKAEFPVNLWPNAAQAYSRFLSSEIAAGTGYDAIVRKMLTGEGSNFRVGEVNFFRAMQARNPASIASCAALSFMNVRFDKLPEDVKRNMAAFFERVAYKSTKEWKEEIVFDDPAKRAPFAGFFPDGKPVSLSADSDPRAAFADWLTRRGNPYFSRAAVNRIWFWLFGRPIVSPVDDMFFGNKSGNGELLDFLAKKFESLDFSLRDFCAFVVASRAYQQSPIPRGEPSETLERFGVYPITRVDAEALIDIICKITDTAEIYESTTPEPYTKFPAGESAVGLPDGSVTTSFLELFGRPSRDTGFASERVDAPSASQRLHMLNSTHIRQKIERGEPFKTLFSLRDQEFLEGVYLAVLSRRPSPAEKRAFFKGLESRGRNGRFSLKSDIVWALFNSEEFLNRH